MMFADGVAPVRGGAFVRTLAARQSGHGGGRDAVGSLDGVRGGLGSRPAALGTRPAAPPRGTRRQNPWGQGKLRIHLILVNIE